MKPVITLLILFIYNFSSWSQKSITTDGPCTDVLAQNTKGRWLKHPSAFDRGSTTSKEANKRIDDFHDLMIRIYPDPSGIDAVWHRSVGPSYFGTKRKYFHNRDNVLTFDYSNKPHFETYYYRCLFFAYYCDPYEKNVMRPGYPGETGTQITITANSIEGSVSSGAPDDTWTINGLPVKMRSPVLKTIRGFELQFPEPGSSTRYVLVYRNGILPYIPVTRKQYLDYCINNKTMLYDEGIKNLEQMPVRSLEEQEQEKKAKLAKFEKDFGSDPKRLKSAVDYYLAGYQTEQQQRDENVNKAKQMKKEEVKKFTDELLKTSKEGLLESPAIVLVKYISSPIFEPDPLKGHMLVTENPDYIRKDLPRHIPQVFVVWWKIQNRPAQIRIGEIIEQDFPFEKLQAMIDK